MRKIWTSLTLLLACSAALPAFADESCPPLTIVSSVDMTIGGSGRIYVPAKVNDTPEYMLLDTGGFFSELTQQTADALKLRTRHTRLEMIGVSGVTTQIAAEASFTLGNLHADSMDFMIMPDTQKVIADMPNAGGILGPNLLTSYDLDLDFAGKKVNLLSQKHCDGKVVYWPADTVTVVPIAISADADHIQVPVRLDGHDYIADLDTGASGTVLNIETAKRDFTLTMGSADTPAVGHLMGDSGPATYAHRFKSLSLEGVTIANPLLHLIPDLVHNKMSNPVDTVSNDTRIRDTKRETGLSDMILGMDVLRRLHVYIAYKEKKLYITPAAPPQAAPAPSH